MTKIKLALKSRTFWTLIVMFVINTVHANSGLFSTGAMDVINPLLTILAAYFKINPSQQYAQSGIASN